jgi:hypothetical protein
LCWQIEHGSGGHFVAITVKARGYRSAVRIPASSFFNIAMMCTSLNLPRLNPLAFVYGPDPTKIWSKMTGLWLDLRNISAALISGRARNFNKSLLD